VNKRLLHLRRRDFIKMPAAAAVGSMIPACSMIAVSDKADAETVGQKAGLNPIHHVLPVIGTGWHGHMFSWSGGAFWFSATESG